MNREMRRMATRTKPAGRVCKPVAVNTMDIAKWFAARIHKDDVREIMSSLLVAFKALREGMATDNDWALLASAMNTAQAIEKLGVVRGLHAQLRLTELALQSVEQRATASGNWRAPVLHTFELDDIRAGLEFHRYQLLQLSHGALTQAIAAAQAEVIGSGGRVLKGVNL